MKSLPEMLERSTEQVRKQFDLTAAQNEELGALARRWRPRLPNRLRQAYPEHSIPPDLKATGNFEHRDGRRRARTGDG